jgi:hypothetical protein
MTSPGCLGVEGKGKAPHWRLTELGCMTDSPTRDFARWNGKSFVDQKTKSRAGKPAHPVLEKRHTTVPDFQHTSRPHRAGKPAHKDDP